MPVKTYTLSVNVRVTKKNLESIPRNIHNIYGIIQNLWNNLLYWLIYNEIEIQDLFSRDNL